MKVQTNVKAGLELTVTSKVSTEVKATSDLTVSFKA
jgi:hypothetical protein